MTANQHEHEFHALWAHWGPYGDQEEHYHPCGCGDVLVGAGRDCVKGQSHERKRWSDYEGEWIRRVGKNAAGRELDGVVHDGYPAVGA